MQSDNYKEGRNPRQKDFSQRNGSSSRNYSQQYPTRSQGQRYHQHPKAEKDLQYKHDLKEKWQPDPRENLYKVSLPNVPAVFTENPAIGVLSELKQDVSGNYGGLTPTVENSIESSLKFWEEFPSDSARLHMLKKVSVLATFKRYLYDSQVSSYKLVLANEFSFLYFVLPWTKYEQEINRIRNYVILFNFCCCYSYP